jgi:hypothetical protein
MNKGMMMNMGMPMTANEIWDTLEETGRFASREAYGSMWADRIDELKAELYADAKEYGVHLSISWSLHNNKFYVQLRKNMG